MPNELVPIVFSALEGVAPATVSNFFAEGINKRLGTTGLNVSQLAAVAAEREMSIQDVMAIPEQDGWEYTGEEPRDGLSYVCSAYVASMWKAAGLFEGALINATEFTPKDCYNMDFFNANYNRP